MRKVCASQGYPNEYRAPPGGRNEPSPAASMRKQPATVPARPARAFMAHPTRFERVTVAFRASLLALPAPVGPLPTAGQSVVRRAELRLRSGPR
jgi:hypothetical protein